MKKIIFTLFSAALLFNSCGNQASNDVEDICDCFLEEGIEDEDDLMDLEYDPKKIKKIAKCALPILEDVRDEMDDMDDEERADYFGDAIKAAVDCECGQKLLLIAAELYDKEDLDDEFDDMIEDLERVIEYSSNYYEYEEYEEAGEDAYYYEGH